MGIATTPAPDAAEQQQQQQSPQAGDTDLTVTEIIDVPTGEAPEDAGQAEDDGVVTIATGPQTVDADIDFVPSVPEGVGEQEGDVARPRLSPLEAIQETSWLSEFVAEEEEEDVVVEEDDAEDDAEDDVEEDAEEDGQTADVNVHIPVEGAREEQRDSNVEPFALDLALTREEEEPVEITIQIRRRSFISPGTYLSLFLTLMKFYFIFGKKKQTSSERCWKVWRLVLVQEMRDRKREWMLMSARVRGLGLNQRFKRRIWRIHLPLPRMGRLLGSSKNLSKGMKDCRWMMLLQRRHVSVFFTGRVIHKTSCYAIC